MCLFEYIFKKMSKLNRIINTHTIFVVSPNGTNIALKRLV